MADPTEGSSTGLSDQLSATNDEVLRTWKDIKAVKNKKDGCKEVLIKFGQEPDSCNLVSLQSSLEALVGKDRKFKKNAKMQEQHSLWLKELYQFPTARPPMQPRSVLPSPCSGCSTLKDVNQKLCHEISSLRGELAAAALEREKRKKTPTRRRSSSSSETVISRAHLQQAVKRKNGVISALRKSRQVLKKNIAQYQSEIARLKKRLETASSGPTEAKRLRKTCNRLSIAVVKARADKTQAASERRVLQRKSTEMHHVIDSLTAEAEERTEETSMLEVKADAKMYSPALRLSVYKCLENQVPVESVSGVISHVIKTLTDLDVPSLPDKTTVSQMAYEMGILSDLRVGEALVTEKDTTLAWDATSIDGSHVNEVHICTQSSVLVLQIDIIPGGKTDDYVNHITACLQDVMNTYGKYVDRDGSVLLQEVHKNIRNTLTDRVAVNHCVVQRLNDVFDSQLLELKCNVHPLDGLASAARQALKCCDVEFGVVSTTYGRDCSAVNFIYGLSKMRYKQGTGDPQGPQGFKVYLREQRVPPGWMARYVGNRLHVLFHLAGVFFCLRRSLLDFLKNKSAVTNSLRSALMKDFENPVILLQLRVLGLLGKLMTGPWMKLFYGNPEKKDHLDMVPHMKKCMASLQAYLADPASLLHQNTDVFGRQLEDDQVLLSLREPLDDTALQNQFNHITSALIKSSITLLERQLGQYLTGELSMPSRATKFQAKSAPVHNIFAEQTLGMSDAQMRRAPNATIGFIDGKVRFKKNHILDHLTNLPQKEQVGRINFAVNQARVMREKRRERQKMTDALIAERQKQRTKDRDSTRRRALERKIKTVIGQSPEVISAKIGEVTEQVQLYISDPTTMDGQYLTHVWDVDGVDTLYNGHVQKIKTTKSKGTIVTIAYWEPSEVEADGVDYAIPLAQLMVDVILGEAVFDV